MGDFNRPTDSPPFAAIVADTPGLIALHDTQAISRTPHFGPTGTFTAFYIEPVEPSPIDHIFLADCATVLRPQALDHQGGGHPHTPRVHDRQGKGAYVYL